MDKALASENCWNTIGVWGNSSCPELKQYSHCRNCPVFINSGKELFEKNTPDGYKEEWTEILSKEKKEKEKWDNSCLIFRLGNEWFGLESSIVVEVTDNSIIHSLPHQRSKMLQGIVNVRGEIKLAVELKDLLDIENDSELKNNLNEKIFKRNIVVRQNNDSWVFPVDEVMGIWKFNEKNVTNLPATAKSNSSNYLRGFIKIKRNIDVGVIVSNKLFESINKKVF